MNATKRVPTQITIYWDTQDPKNEGWAFNASDDSGLIASGPIEDVGDGDLDGAIREACWELGVEDLQEHFALEPNRDGGCAHYTI